MISENQPFVRNSLIIMKPGLNVHHAAFLWV